MKKATGLWLVLCMWFISQASCAKQAFAEKMFGVWMPKRGVTPVSILGPISYQFLAHNPIGGFSAQRDSSTGDVWFTLLRGQVWHVTGDQVQYCFGQKVLFEQSPFDVRNVTDDRVLICWRDGLRGMPTHKKGCSGCDCAKIEIKLEDDDHLRFTFWMSPPVKHADIHFTRHGPMPGISSIWSTMPFPYHQCGIRDHYGPNVPGQPDLSKGRRRAPLRTHPADEDYAIRNGLSPVMPWNLTNYNYSEVHGGCAQTMELTQMLNDDVRFALQQAEEEVDAVAVAEPNGLRGRKLCKQLNGLNLKLDQLTTLEPDQVYGVSDVRIQYTRPWGRCDPCDVTWEVSAKIEDDEYISFGFKGQSWEHLFPFPPETQRPCYFGMCIDDYDNFTSDRIAVGYSTPSNGAAFREMVAKNVIGAPVDADYKLFKDTSVVRAQGRTWIRFTISQHWRKSGDAAPQTDGPFRVMWAIGKVSGGSNGAATIGYHAVHRAVHPISWLMKLGSQPCKAEPFPSEQPHIVHV